MRASDFDKVIDCPECDGNQSCTFCDDGEFSYYAPANPAETDRDVLIYAVDSDGDGQVKKMINAERANALAGDGKMEPSTDDNEDVLIDSDKADRMRNQLGKNAPYELENGNTVTEDDMLNGWPSDPNLSANEVIAWLKARGDDTFAEELREAAKNVGISL